MARKSINEKQTGWLKRRILAAALCAVMTVSGMTAVLTGCSEEPADSLEEYAAEWDEDLEVTPERCFYFTEVEGRYSVGISKARRDRTIFIPDTYNGKPVVAVTGGGASWEHLRDDIVSVVIPDSVVTVGPRAFRDCSNLESITLGDGVKFIGEEAFSGCTALERIDISEDNQNLSSDNGVVYSGDGENLIYCPRGYSGELDLSGKELMIETAAFRDCSRITRITLPDVTYGINEKPGGLFSFGEINIRTFDGCVSLTDVDVSGANTQYSSVDGVLYSKDGTELVYCPEGKQGTCAIPEGVKTIRDGAFDDCDRLEKVTVPASLEEIGTDCFDSCGSLKEITAAKDHTAYSSVDGVLFSKDGTRLIKCPAGLTGSYTIPAGVELVDGSAFDDCEGLTALSIPAGAKLADTWDASVGDYALEEATIYGKGDGLNGTWFAAMDRPDSITVAEDCTGYEMVGDVLYGNNGKTLVYCFDKSISEFTVPDGVTAISDMAFCGCGNLENILLPDSLTAIGDSAFVSCRSLARTVLPDGVKTIGDEAFCQCEKLESIELPDSLDAIGCGAFAGCWRLKEMTLPDGITAIGDSAFYGCSSLTEIALPDSVTTLGESVFEDCTALESITLSAGLKEIDGTSFGRVESLRTINVPEKSRYLKVVDGILFSKDGKTLIMCPRAAELPGGSCVVPGGVTIIGKNAFYGCGGLTEITLPEGLISIEEGAFLWCGLTELVLPESVTTLGECISDGLELIAPHELDYYYGGRTDYNVFIES